MGLEEDIHQTAFRSEYHKLAVNILYTHGWLVSHIAGTLRPHGITMQQYNILRILRGQHPAPADFALIRERLLDHGSDVSRLVERLRAKGLLERHASSSDRRKSGVLITQKGLNLLSRLDDLDPLTGALFQGVTQEQARAANCTLDALRAM